MFRYLEKIVEEAGSGLERVLCVNINFGGGGGLWGV